MKKRYLLKILAIVIACTMTTDLLAQTFGVKGGLNFSNMLAKDDFDNLSEDFKMNPGFHAGISAEFPFGGMYSYNETFAFETGLLISTKGFRLSERERNMGETYRLESKTKMSLLYVDMPLMAKAYYDLGSAKIYGALGPYLGVGISGQIKSYGKL